MTILHRFLSEDITTETTCEYSDCFKEWKVSGSCPSPKCYIECPFLCKVIEVTNLPPPPPPVILHHDNLKKFMIITASSIITTMFLLTLVILCFKFYQSRRRRSVITTTSRRWSLEEARNWDLDGPSSVIIDHPVWHIRTIGLNPSVISSIKVCKYSKEDGVVEGTDCSVCLSEFEEEETLRLLPKCKHAFHLSCIDTWLRSHTNCPLCRAPIVSIKDDHSEGIEEENRVNIPEENGEIGEETEEEERDGFDGNVSVDNGEEDESKQRVRRSVSLNSLSGLRGKEKVMKRGSSIVGRSSFLKRSISYNGK